MIITHKLYLNHLKRDYKAIYQSKSLTKNVSIPDRADIVCLGPPDTNDELPDVYMQKNLSEPEPQPVMPVIQEQSLIC
jgi:hypothetical protein